MKDNTLTFEQLERLEQLASLAGTGVELTNEEFSGLMNCIKSQQVHIMDLERLLRIIQDWLPITKDKFNVYNLLNDTIDERILKI